MSIVVGAAVEKVRLELVFPSSARDQFGNTGTWTMIYNQVTLFNILQITEMEAVIKVALGSILTKLWKIQGW